MLGTGDGKANKPEKTSAFPERCCTWDGVAAGSGFRQRHVSCGMRAVKVHERTGGCFSSIKSV